MRTQYCEMQIRIISFEIVLILKLVCEDKVISNCNKLLHLKTNENWARFW